MNKIKSEITKGLANIADVININSSCCLFWGEVKLPKCLRNKTSKSNDDKKTKL